MPSVGHHSRVAAVVVALLAPALAWGFVADRGSRPPPAAGPYAYERTHGQFGPDRKGFPRRGGSYVDPVFGTAVRRLTSEFPRPSNSDIYGKNGFWNADATRLFHNNGQSKTIIDTTTGKTVRWGVPGTADGSFAPDDRDVWYYFSGASLMRYSIAKDTSRTVKKFGGALQPLGGSVDWIDGSGRYMVLNVGGHARVWDRHRDVLYDGAVRADIGGGWVGITPDARYVVVSADGRSHRSFAVDHDARALSTNGVLFWTLCGGHGDLVSASDGKSYYVTWECHADPGVWAVDITKPQSKSDVARQHADNRKLLDTAWDDEGHMSRVSRGPLRDWVYVSIESNDDAFTSDVSRWRPFKQEILMVNAVTGAVRRLAHHRSRGIKGGSYYAQPRVSASWDGSRVAWASNFGYGRTDGYADIYSIEVPR